MRQIRIARVYRGACRRLVLRRFGLEVFYTLESERIMVGATLDLHQESGSNRRRLSFERARLRNRVRERTLAPIREVRSRRKRFQELCEILFDGIIEPSILHIPRHCGFGTPEVFFLSGSTRSRLSSNIRRSVLYVAGRVWERLIFDSLVPAISLSDDKLIVRNRECFKSAKIELCVIRRVSLIKNFPGPVLRNCEGILF